MLRMALSVLGGKAAWTASHLVPRAAATAASGGGCQQQQQLPASALRVLAAARPHAAFINQAQRRLSVSAVSDTRGTLQQQLQQREEETAAAAAGTAGGAVGTKASRPARPRPRKSTASQPALDEAEPSPRKRAASSSSNGNKAAAAAVTETSAGAAATTQGPSPQAAAEAIGSIYNSSSSSSNGGSSAPAVVQQQPQQQPQRQRQQQPQQQPQQQQQSEPNMAVRNAFVRSTSSGPLIGPSQPVSSAALAWCQQLGIGAETLQHWQAGMATVWHPGQQQQVEVLALPYHWGGRLVDVRYLQLTVDGRLASSWLARGTAQLFARQQDLQEARTVVFVSSELDALLLSSLGIAAVATPRQAPNWLAPAPGTQQQQQQQQEQPAGPAQQRQQSAREDPRLRLTTLAAELSKLQRQFELGAAANSNSSNDSHSSSSRLVEEGLVVSDVAAPPVSGLGLLLPSAHVAVIAMEQGQEGEAVGAALAALLGEVSCRHIRWPEGSPQDLLPPAEQSGQDGAAAAGGQDAAAAAAAGQDTVEPTASSDDYGSAALSEQQLLGLEHLLGRRVDGWSCLATAVLLGEQELRQAVDDAFVWPIPGLERFSDYAMQLMAYFETEDVRSLACSTGWPSLDACYRVAPGEVTLVTGVPNSGKSEWLDALAVNLALQQGWRFAVCSMEKRPRDHARQLVEKIAGKPLLTASYAGDVPRMTEEELTSAYRLLCEHFVAIVAGEDSMPSISWVLDKAKAAVIHHGINGLIIDPYNELDPTRAASLQEHEHVNQLMGLLRKFARENAVHCWLVAHPRQMASNWQGQRPGLQDISGGANFMNKADNGIIVHRDWSKLQEMRQRAAAAAAKGGGGGGGAAGNGSSRRRRPASSSDDGADTAAAGDDGDAAAAAEAAAAEAASQEYRVRIYVEKVRNKTSGCKGEAELAYDRVTGRYHEVWEQPARGFMGAADWSEANEAFEQQEDASSQLREQAQQAEQQQQRDGGGGELSEEEVLAANRERAMDG